MNRTAFSTFEMPMDCRPRANASIAKDTHETEYNDSNARSKVRDTTEFPENEPCLIATTTETKDWERVVNTRAVASGNGI